MRHAAIALVLAVAAASSLDAQAPASRPAFDVASVKRNTSGGTAMRIIWPRGRFSAVNVLVRQFIEVAYQVESFRIAGGPGWIGADRFDIEATVVAELPPARRGLPEPIQMMMRTLLADRFKAVTHWEKRPQTIYTLVRAKANGGLGPKLRKSEVDCPTLMASAARGGPLPPPSMCGVQRRPGGLLAGGLPIAQLVGYLTTSLQRVVVDRTGLAGDFNVDLTWTPDQPPPDGAPSAPDVPDVRSAGPSLFTALQEQLGLKLESARGPVDVLVIDHVDRPTED
jgi:uncharacterized protein (TIGR03435 family)